MNFCHLGLAVLETEAQALLDLTQRIDSSFQKACEIMISCKGRIIVSGMGKSGHIGNKLAATLASTGTPSFFMHPGEASHGDLGMVTPDDVVLAISYSGTTQELVTILPLLKRLNVPLIAMTGNPNSVLAQTATANINIQIKHEACPLGLAPTTSTTATLAMGDALAIALLQARGFTEEDFARSHPGGALGRKLLLRVDDLCHNGDAMPVVLDSTTVAQALIEVSEKKLGMTSVVNEKGTLCGIFTDGDIRRTLTQGLNISETLIREVMTHNTQTIKPGLLAAEALSIMQSQKISSLVLVNNSNEPAGVLHLQDLLQAGVI